MRSPSQTEIPRMLSRALAPGGGASLGEPKTEGWASPSLGRCQSCASSRTVSTNLPKTGLTVSIELDEATRDEHGPEHEVVRLGERAEACRDRSQQVARVLAAVPPYDDSQRAVKAQASCFLLDCLGLITFGLRRPQTRRDPEPRAVAPAPQSLRPPAGGVLPLRPSPTSSPAFERESSWRRTTTSCLRRSGRARLAHRPERPLAAVVGRLSWWECIM